MKNESAIIILWSLATHYIVRPKFNLLTNPKVPHQLSTIGSLPRAIFHAQNTWLLYFSVIISESLDNF